jgi:hypothetical protein
MKKYSLFLLLVSGCDFVGTKQSSPLYTHSHRQIAPYEYELTMEGKEDLSADQLKNLFKKHGYELCHNRVYLLRGLRQEEHSAEKKIVLKGLVDCVTPDYFRS